MDELNEKLMDYCKNADSEDAWTVTRILLDMRKMDRENADRAEKAAERAHKDRRFTLILCVVALIACLVTGGIFGLLASGIQIETTTTTTTVEQDTGEGGGDAVYQSGEHAQFYAQGSGGGE